MAFVRSDKPYEKRIAILPQDLQGVKHCDALYFEKGYGRDFQIQDEEYIRCGCHITTREHALEKDIICDTKIGEANYLHKLKKGTILTGWIHAGGNREACDTMLRKQFTCYAWEDFYEEGRHLFWRNNQIAGAGGVLNAFQYTGYFPYGLCAGIIGRGDSATGAYHMLSLLGADVREYSREQEKLFIKELPIFDIIVIAVRWDTSRKDYIVSSHSRKCMKRNAILIDISGDADGAIEQSVATTIQDPIYYLDDIMVYGVNNIPSIYYKDATKGVSAVMCEYIDKFIEQVEDPVLEDSIIIKGGKILDKQISEQRDC